MESAKKSLYQMGTAQKIAIICHSKPDADAFSSMIALKRLIKKNFETEKYKINIDVFADTDEVSDKYAPLLNGENLNEQTAEKYDLAIAVDCANKSRLGKYEVVFDNAKDTLNIDHHQTNDKFAHNNIIKTHCSSTCEIVYLYYGKVAGLKISSDICSLLYSGIITDTNNLTQNLSSFTLEAVTELQQTCNQENVNLEKIRDHFFKNDTKEQLSLLGRALSSLSFCENGKIAMMKILKQDFAETNATKDDTLGIVDYACKLQGVEIGVLFIKQENNTYYVSLRSKGELDVSEIAKNMGGGGHKNIAAFATTENDNLTDIKTKLVGLCKTELEKQQNNDENIESLFAEMIE